MVHFRCGGIDMTRKEKVIELQTKGAKNGPKC
jgi:hypothetical protein